MSYRLRILLADESAETRNGLSRLLTRLGHEVVGEAASGRELFERCRAARPDLVMSEMRLSGTDGLAAAERITRRWQVPVVITTGCDDDGLLGRVEMSGVVTCLVKPVREADLKVTLAVTLPRFLRQRALDRELEERRQGERARRHLMKRLRISEDEAVRVAERMIVQMDRL
jgi:AmiR/NasT family two-component response regulator